MSSVLSRNKTFSSDILWQQGCQNPGIEGCNSSRFSELPGRQLFHLGCHLPVRTENPAGSWPSRTGFPHPCREISGGMFDSPGHTRMETIWVQRGGGNYKWIRPISENYTCLWLGKFFLIFAACWSHTEKPVEADDCRCETWLSGCAISDKEWPL